MTFLNKIILYARVFRWGRTVNFSFAILGILYASGFNFDYRLFPRLILIYLIYGILLYGGIYSLNGYTERSEDLKRGDKKNRLIPSGRVSPKIVLTLSLSFLAASFIFGWILLRDLILFQVFFLTVNLFYTLVFKKLNSYLAILTVAATGPTKFLLGYYLISGALVFDIPLVHYLCSIAYHTRKFIYSGTVNRKLGNYINTVAFILAAGLSIFLVGRGVWLVLIILLPSLTDSVLYYVNPSYKDSLHKKWDRE